MTTNPTTNPFTNPTTNPFTNPSANPTASTNDLTASPSRTPLIAALGIAAASVLTAVGTFWATNDRASEHSASEWLITVGIIAVAAAIVFGLVVRTAPAGNPGRRAAVLGVVSVLALAVFWAGLPMVLVAGAVACALADRDRHGSFGAGSKAALALAPVVTTLAVWLAIAG